MFERGKYMVDGSLFTESLPVIVLPNESKPLTKPLMADRSSSWLIEPHAKGIDHRLFGLNNYIALLKEIAPEDALGRNTIRLKAYERPEWNQDHLKVAGAIDWSKRVINGIRINIGYQRGNLEPSVYGIRLDAAIENEQLSDHNFSHTRRSERALVATIFNTPELHSEAARRWYDSAFMAVNFHDWGQLMSIYAKEVEGKAIKKVKPGHALDGALQALVYKDRLIEASLYDQENAWDIVKGAAFMMMDHDRPEAISQTLAGSISAVGLNDDETFVHFQQHQLDLTTISPCQMLMIMKRQKIEGNAMPPDSLYGFDHDFETEYADILSHLAQDSQPLFERGQLSNEDKAGLHLMTEAFVDADVEDMVSPTFDAIYRTLLTEYSRGRPLIITDSQEFRSYVNSELKKKNKPQLEEDASYADYFIALVVHGDGNTPKEFAAQDCDLRRLLAEFAMITENDTQLHTTDYTKEKHRVNALMGVLAVHDVVSRLAQKDYSVIDESSRKSRLLLVRKALKRSGIKTEERYHLEAVARNIDQSVRGAYELFQAIPTEDDLQFFRESVRGRLSKEVNSRLDQVFDITSKVYNQVYQRVSDPKILIGTKGGEAGGEDRSKVLAQVDSIIHGVLEHIVRSMYYEGIEADVEKYRALTGRQEQSYLSHSSTFASMATPADARTLRRPKSAMIATDQ
jgi:hypothetical protein